MAKDKSKKTVRSNKSDAYEVKGGKITVKKQECPKCGSCVFLADHKNRAHCGKCGYTKWKN
ncbi:MAG: 30S ribosomal protein S27ae [Candidatus Micrarchaeota archaeon]